MVKVGIVVNALFLLVLGGFISVSSAQPPPPSVKKEIAEERAELTADAKEAIKDIVSTDADRQKVAQLRHLLKKRHSLVKSGVPEGEIFDVDRQILEVLATVDEANREKITEALERLWDAEEDYYETLEDILENLDAYKPYLVTTYETLPPWRVFIKDWKPKRVIVRQKLPPYPWRAKKPLVKPPRFRPTKPGPHPPKPGISAPMPAAKPPEKPAPKPPAVKPPNAKPGPPAGPKPAAPRPPPKRR